MEMMKVESSNVIAIGHDGNDLYVEYASGIYKYNNVPKALYEKFLKAPSKGKFMNEEIKDKYEYVKFINFQKLQKS